MNRIKISFILCGIAAAVLGLAYPAGAQTARNSTSVKQIDTYARGVAAYGRTHKNAAIIAADTSDYGGSEPENWRVFKNRAAYRAYEADNGVYSLASSWRQNGRLVLAEFTFTSPSGDWAHYVNNYYRRNGSIAKVESEMRTFINDCVIKKNLYFDEKGRQFHESAKYFDLKSNRPKKRCDALGTSEVKFYKSVDELPFGKLVP